MLYDGRHELYRKACMRQNPERPRQEEKHTCGIFECSISLLRPCPTCASLGHPRSDFSLPRRPCPHTHPRVAAPFLRITSAHVFRKLLLHAAATACECCVRHMALTRVVYPALSKAGRFATASLRSRARSALRNQAQYFSIGLGSGLRGGMCHMHTLALACACLLRAVDNAHRMLYDGRHELYRKACMRQNPERPRQEEKHTWHF